MTMSNRQIVGNPPTLISGGASMDRPIDAQNLRKIGIIGRSNTAVEYDHQSWPIALDNYLIPVDTASITPVPPLPLVGDVQLGWVFLCPDGSGYRRGGRHG